LNLHRAQARSLDVGCGAGIQSYPSSLDPYDALDHDPIAYPSLDLHFHLVDHMSVTGHVARIKTENTCAGLIWCRQYVEVYTLGFGVDYNFGTAVRQLALGAQVLTGFSDYTCGGSNAATTHGFGLRVRLCTAQPITEFLSWGTLVGAQRLRTTVVPDSDPLNLDSFFVELVGYVSL
jgi:hypothetical protein